MQNQVRYSIIVPVRNCRPYIKATIESVINQNYDNYELIISDNCSTDGTKEFIEQYQKYKNMKILHTENYLNLAEHFDWAQTHASGEWQIFLGGDDGLQPYFFKLADRLTEIAIDKNLRAITSKRAYFFWKNCSSKYSYTAVNYNAVEKITVENCDKQIFKQLYGKRESGYFDLPQMYTTSLFHYSLIKKARETQKGLLIPYAFYAQDIQLAALSLSIENKFLESYIPLGWVGTSGKGTAEYWKEEFRDMIFLNMGIYPYELGMWDILLKTTKLWKPQIYKKLNSHFFKLKLFAYALISIEYRNKDSVYSFEPIFAYMKTNKIPVQIVITISRTIVFFELLAEYLFKFIFFPWRCIRYILKRLPLTKKYFTVVPSSCSIYIKYTEEPDITMSKASQLVDNMMPFDFTKLKISK